MTEAVTTCSDCEALKKELSRLTTRTVNQDYMLIAIAQMLGPKGREVYEMWKNEGVVRTHTSWAPGAELLTGEEIAQVHLDLAAAPKTLITNVDGDVEKVRYDAPMTKIEPVDDIIHRCEKDCWLHGPLDTTPPEYPTPEMIAAAKAAAERTGRNLDERSDELTQAVREGLEAGAKQNFYTTRLSTMDHMRILRSLLDRPGPQDYRLEESRKYLDRMVLETDTLPGSATPMYPDDGGLKEQVRPLGETFNSFEMIMDHFTSVPKKDENNE